MSVFTSGLCLPISAHIEEIPGAAGAFLLVGSFSGRGCELVAKCSSVPPTFTSKCTGTSYFLYFFFILCWEFCWRQLALQCMY